eukprot:EG_transcript_57377
MHRFLFLCLCLFLLVDGLVDDKAELLSPAAVAQLEGAISGLKQQTGYDVVVLTKPVGEVEASSAREVARAYVGDRLRGVVFLVTPKSLYIFNSKSLDDVLTAVVKQRIW